jgi:hypothetical protein
MLGSFSIEEKTKGEREGGYGELEKNVYFRRFRKCEEASWKLIINPY